MRCNRRSANDGTSVRGLEEVSTRAADDETVLSAFAQMGSLDPGSATDLLDENTRAATSRKVSAAPPPARRLARRRIGRRRRHSRGWPMGARIEVRRRGRDERRSAARLAIKVRDRLGAVEFLEIDNSGRMFVFAENIPVSCRDRRCLRRALFGRRSA